MGEDWAEGRGAMLRAGSVGATRLDAPNVRHAPVGEATRSVASMASTLAHRIDRIAGQIRLQPAQPNGTIGGETPPPDLAGCVQMARAELERAHKTLQGIEHELGLTES